MSARTIRFYEDHGFIPEPARDPNGYRNYGDEDVNRLRFVRAAQESGLSLREIRDILAIRVDGRLLAHPNPARRPGGRM